MIRLITKSITPCYDGESDISFQTFDVELPEVESHLARKHGYSNSGTTQIIGSEIINSQWPFGKLMLIGIFESDWREITSQCEQLKLSPEKFINKILHNYLVSDCKEDNK